MSSNSAITRFPIANWVFPANGAAGVNAPIFTVNSLTTDPNGNVVFADQVPVSSATLVPGYTGIYVIQATLPNGISPGAATPLVVTTLSQSSPAENISVN